MLWGLGSGEDGVIAGSGELCGRLWSDGDNDEGSTEKDERKNRNDRKSYIHTCDIIGSAIVTAWMSSRRSRS